MAHQTSRKNPFKGQIIKDLADNVAEEMMAEIRDEVAVWTEKLPITSIKVRSTEITKVFQERFMQRLAEQQEQIAQQTEERRRQVAGQIPSGRVRGEMHAKETQVFKEIEQDFDRHMRRCALLASNILSESIAFGNREKRIEEEVGRGMEVVLRQNEEQWMEMGKVSWFEFEKEWEEKFGNA